MPNKRALIVDDSSTAQYRLKRMLRPYNLDIDTADTGEAALRYLAHHSPDVIFMDHLMPGMDGLRALQIIKSHPETATIPVIMYTSKSGDLYTGQARALGALDVVNKDTINAVELSKVMEAIHMYRSSVTQDETQQNPHTITAEDVTKDITSHQIERRVPHPATIEHAKNVELRLSHMEHTLEDSRRFITSRVARELDGLRHNLKKELSELLTNNQSSIESNDANNTQIPASRHYSLLSRVFIIILLVVVAILFLQIHSILSDSQLQQQQLKEQLNTLTAQQITDKILLPAAATKQASPASPSTDSGYKSTAYLADLAWAFNQNGLIAFNQNNIEQKKIIQLYELLNRLNNNGFNGRAWINIYVGNFCASIDNYGIAQMPKENATMNDCILSSEIYGLDRIMEEYTHDAETALKGLEQDSDRKMHLVINTLVEPDGYPERKATLAAKSWNMVAQNHNRIELRLEESIPPHKN